MLSFKLAQGNGKSLLFLTKRSFRTWSAKGASAKPKTAAKPAEAAAKDAKSTQAPTPLGIPYKRLTIGVPKEVWPNERRLVKVTRYVTEF